MSTETENKPRLFDPEEVLRKLEANLVYSIKEYEREAIRLNAKIEEAETILSNLRQWKEAKQS